MTSAEQDAARAAAYRLGGEQAVVELFGPGEEGTCPRCEGGGLCPVNPRVNCWLCVGRCIVKRSDDSDLPPWLVPLPVARVEERWRELYPLIGGSW